MKFSIALLGLIVGSWLFVLSAFASELPTVSVVNPLRGPQLGLENSDLVESLESQWAATKKGGVRATWLWQYSALEEKGMVDVAKREMMGQEHGIFLEIDKNVAGQLGIPYKGESSWYFSDGLLLVAYDKGEREKFISAVFEKFKSTFGYYPKTVGAWWVGAESIEYMQQKYGITGVIQCSDQFATDAYSLWGTPWSIPYRSDKTNAAKPAQTLGGSSRVVIMQWAPRDPTEGYGKDVEASTFSMQDYPLKGYDHSYIDHLIAIYLKKPLDQVVIGLEGGLPQTSYEGVYGQQVQHIKALEQKNRLVIKPVSEYASEFLKSYRVVPPTNSFLANGYQNDDQSFWMNTPSYRVGIKKEGKNVYLIDLRDYLSTPSEDFYTLPNLEKMLRINTRGIIDTVRFPKQKIRLADATVLSKDEKNGTIFLKADGKTIGEFGEDSYIFPTLTHDEQENLQSAGGSVSYTLLKQPYVVLSFLFGLYVIFLSFLKIRRDMFFQAAIFLILSVVIMYPFFSSWYTRDGSILFSATSLQFLPLANFFPFDIPTTLLFIYQIFPFVLLLLINFIFVSLRKRGEVVWLSYLFLLFVLLLFSSEMYLAFLHALSSGKKTLFITLLELGVIGAIWISLFSFVTREGWGKKMICVGLLFMVVSIIFTSQKLFEEKRIILTPFEMEAMQYVEGQHMPATLLTPRSGFSYRAVYPFLNEDVALIGNLFGKGLSEESNISSRTEGIVIVPRYLKREVTEDVVGRYRLEKIFDNAQIEIYDAN